MKEYPDFHVSRYVAMSWDLLAMKFPPGVRNLDELPDDFKETPIGRSAEITKLILALPGAKAHGEGQMTIEWDGYAIQFSLDDKEFCTCIMFFVYGNGIAAAPVLRRIGEMISARVWDINGAQFLDMAEDPAAGFKEFKRFRDHVLKAVGADQKNE